MYSSKSACVTWVQLHNFVPEMEVECLGRTWSDALFQSQHLPPLCSDTGGAGRCQSRHEGKQSLSIYIAARHFEFV